MSNLPARSAREKVSVAIALASTLALSVIGPVLAQSTTDTTTSSTAASPTVTSTTTTLTPVPDVAPGVWTAPKYAVKEKVQVKTETRSGDPSVPPTASTTTTTTSTTTATTANVYDEAGAQKFATSLAAPQLVWTRQDPATRGQKTAALNLTKEIAAYNRSIVEKFVANLNVPNNASLVESTQVNYVYLVSFRIDSKGVISHVNNETSFGGYNATNLSDDGENRLMNSAIDSALMKCSPLAVPPAGIPPWYMLLRYEPNTGKVFVANLNTI